MTETEWLDGSAPGEMFEYVQEHPRRRLVRLFCLACCRRVWGSLADDRSRAAVLAMEAEVERRDSPLLYESEAVQPDVWLVARMAAVAVRNADAPLVAARHAAESVVLTAAGGTGGPLGLPLNAAIQAACEALQDAASRLTSPPDFDDPDPGEESVQRELIRDIFGNPFRSIAFSPLWRTDTAVSLARQMYDAREFSAMPILADALQDAGCDSAEILDHCRGAGPHVRGCWVVDLVLGFA
jgi:hypothetical protein